MGKLKIKYMTQYNKLLKLINCYLDMPAEEIFNSIKKDFSCSNVVEEKNWFGTKQSTPNVRMLIGYKDIVVEVTFTAGGLYLMSNADCYEENVFIGTLKTPQKFLKKREW